jgi:hypothetical protein
MESFIAVGGLVVFLIWIALSNQSHNRAHRNAAILHQRIKILEDEVERMRCRMIKRESSAKNPTAETTKLTPEEKHEIAWNNR